MAASYAIGFARNHAFVDGNERTAWVLARLFLKANGLEIDFNEQNAIQIMLAFAAGEPTEDELISWLLERIERA